MLKFYNVYYTTYHNGTKIGITNATILEEESNIERKKTYDLTWDNLDNFYYNNTLKCSFTWHMTSKGRVVRFFVDKIILTGNYAQVKEWKKPLNITIVETACEITGLMSIQDVLAWHDSERAMQFLRERNLLVPDNKNM